jgi:hypothetical protein
MAPELRGERMIRSPNLYGDPATVLRYISVITPIGLYADTFSVAFMATTQRETQISL